MDINENIGADEALTQEAPCEAVEENIDELAAKDEVGASAEEAAKTEEDASIDAETEEVAEEPSEAPEALCEAVGSEEVFADGAEVEERISDEEYARVLKNPMFALFSRGRTGDTESAVRDFKKMLSSAGSGVSEEDRARMAPSSGYGALRDFGLSERQRKIARDAGMSYREYHALISSIPVKSYFS